MSYFPEALKDIVRELLSDGEAPTATVAARLRERLAAGQDTGADIYLALLIDRAGGDVVKEVLKEDTYAVTFTQAGKARRIVMKARYAVPIIDPDTGRVAGYRLRLTLALDWDEFEALVLRLVGQASTLAEAVEGLRQIARLRERFPQSRTPLEAVGLAGLNPADLAL